MADDLDPKEQEYIKKSRWLAFKSSAWNNLGVASFFGALTSVVASAISTAAGIPAFTASGIPTASAILASGLGPLAVVAGVVAFGAYAIYKSQEASTELGLMNGQHQAEQQAKCMAKAKGMEPEQMVEHEQNCRADGKKWEEVAKAQNKPTLVVSR